MTLPRGTVTWPVKMSMGPTHIIITFTRLVVTNPLLNVLGAGTDRLGAGTDRLWAGTDRYSQTLVAAKIIHILFKFAMIAGYSTATVECTFSARKWIDTDYRIVGD